LKGFEKRRDGEKEKERKRDLYGLDFVRREEMRGRDEE
jgi:hypothetical protein